MLTRGQNVCGSAYIVWHRPKRPMKPDYLRIAVWMAVLAGVLAFWALGAAAFMSLVG